MELWSKYRKLLETAATSMKGFESNMEGGRLYIKGASTYQLDKDRFWDELKSHEDWEKEISADIEVDNDALYGVYTVEAGDSLSQIAKRFLGAAGRYPEIFEANTDVLTNPDKIQIGQELKIPKRSKSQ